MTTFGAMQMSRPKTRIIDVPGRAARWLGLLLALALLGGCSSMRLAYNNAPQLAWWWLDAYVDFSREQAPRVKQALQELLDWHRSTQLPHYLPALAAARKLVAGPVTADQVCRWQDHARERIEPTLQRALTAAAAQLPGLSETQFRHIEAHQLKSLDEVRDNFLQDDPAERQAAAVKRAVERAERLYGRLEAAQRRVVQAGVQASPFDPVRWLKERQRRQRELMATLRRLAADGADADQRLAALRMLLAHSERSPDADYRDYQARLTAYDCAFTAQIHNATTPAQRQAALNTLQGWENDLRALAAP